jgi:uncharacterized secreted protein with C-terminal beta-propeller domain
MGAEPHAGCDRLNDMTSMGNTRGVRRGLALLAAITVIAAGCTSGGDADQPAARPAGNGADDPVVTLPDDAVLVRALQPFDSCDTYLAYVKERALEMVGPYGLDGGYGPPVAFAAEDDAAAEGAERAESAAPATTGAAAQDEAAGGGTDFSTTNVQEVGVDEPDILKSDGRRIVALAQGQLHVIDVTGPEPVLTGTVPLGDVAATEMFLSGDRVVLFGYGDLHFLPAESRLATSPEEFRESMRIVDVDISDPAAPTVNRTMVLHGGYVSARLVNGVARVVVREWGPALPWVYDRPTEGEAVEANRQVIRDSTVDQWLPGYSVLDGQGNIVSEGRLVDCARMHRPEVFGGLGSVTVATIDIAAGLGDRPVDAVGVLGTGETVYSSPTGLYVTTTDWQWQTGVEGDVDLDEVTTEIHRFDISQPTSTAYVASGSVPGYVLNQWALDEYEGNLRVATTKAPSWWGPDVDSESLLTVLATSGEALVPVGQVGGLGRGEAIQAVRYFDDLATVVTFRQTDPLYTIDLADPAHPTVLGELKINGFSAYLHPIGDGLLLGVGQDATDEGFTTGTQVSVFDLRDRANPVRIGQWTVPGGDSEAQFDSRAFLWWPQSSMAVIPLNIWGTGAIPEPLIEGDIVSPPEAPWLGAVGVTVGTDGTITEVGRLSQQGPPTQKTECWVNAMPAAEAQAYIEGLAGSTTETAEILGPVPGDPNFVNVRMCSTWTDYDWQSQIRRTAVVGDTLFTLSEKGLLAADLATLAPRTLVQFPAPPASSTGGGVAPAPAGG